MKTIDDLLEDIGGFGKFQVYVVLGLLLPLLNGSWSIIQIEFIVSTPNFECLVDVPERAIITNPVVASSNGRINHSVAVTNACSINGTHCNAYRFEGTWTTAVTEWNLVCHLKWITKMVESLQMIGVMVGGIAMGQLSDLYGRKKIYCASLILQAVFNFVTAFSVSLEMFAAMRFLVGVSTGAVMFMAIPYVVEFLPRRWRFGSVLFPTTVFGVMLSAGMEALLVNFLYLHIAVAVSALVFVPLLFCMPEGVRWLAVQGRTEEAEKIIGNIARINKRTVPNTTVKALLLRVAEEGAESRRERRSMFSYLHIFDNWLCLKLSCAGGLVMCCSAIVYFGTYFEASNLAGNMFLNTVIMSMAQIPSNLSTLPLSNILGRRLTCTLFFSLGTLSYVICAILHFQMPDGREKVLLISIFSVLALVTVETGWVVFVIWSLELYPTTVRTTGYAFLSLMYRIGGIISPYGLDLVDAQVRSFLTMSGLLFLSSLFLFCLPETKDAAMPNVIDSSKKMEKKRVNQNELNESSRLIANANRCYGNG